MEESVNVLKFAEARASEIASLMENVNYKRNKTATQKLPPHMRRRAASHNPRRVPRKLRNSYIAQNPNASTKPKKPPKKTRKKQIKKRHEKQKKNYAEEYASRSRPDEMWLGTHIWHAKRCKMKNLWGYKIPIHCNDKKLGATHQAATKHAMLQDLSYFCCIELKGPENLLYNGLACLTNPDTGNHFASEMYCDGIREGHTYVYHPSKFPYQAIGPVTFIWKPIPTCISDSNSPRKLWIWCHPSFHDELTNVLITVFNLQEITVESHTQSAPQLENVNDETSVGETTEEKDKMLFVSKITFEKTKLHFQKEKLYSNNDIQLTLLKDQLVRHRVIGPNAQSVIANVLEIAGVEEDLKMHNTDTIGGKLEEHFFSETNNNELHVIKGALKRKHIEDNTYSNVPKKVKFDSAIEVVKLDSASISPDFDLHLVKDPKCNTEASGTVDELKLIINGTLDSKQKFDSKLTFTETSHCSVELLKDSSVKEVKLNNLEKNELKPSVTSHKKFWWQPYFENESEKISHQNKKRLLDYLRNERSNYYIPPHTVIGLTVRDPRLILSVDKKKFSSGPECSDMAKCMEEFVTPDVANSPLWDRDIRNEVTANQMSEREINEERAKYVIPSESLNFGNKESRVPILLIHQPGTDGFCSGWDLIAPLGWSMAFWIPLVLNGGRVTGLRDLNFINLETGQPSFPLSHPDTKAGVLCEETLRTEQLTKHYKRPKAKRANFSVFGIPNPFHMPWKVLVDDWQNELKNQKENIMFPFLPPTSFPDQLFNSLPDKDCNEEFFVMRQATIRRLQFLCERLSKLPKRINPQVIKEIENLKLVFNELVMSIINSEIQFIKSLVLIRLRCISRGCPTMHSGVYLLNDSDLKEVKSNFNFLGPVEPNHSSCKKTLQVNFSNKDEDLSTDKKEISAKDTENNWTFHTQNDSDSLNRPEIKSLNSCSSRKMIGYLSEGGFSSIMGKGCGIGHCSFVGLLYVLKSCINAGVHPFVLIREQHSFQYRVSTVEIITNYL